MSIENVFLCKKKYILEIISRKLSGHKENTKHHIMMKIYWYKDVMKLNKFAGCGHLLLLFGLPHQDIPHGNLIARLQGLQLIDL